ncbi:Uncharacterised protein [Bordetella pertussis]|nr:Uncharacterised protein [Bordetella pertussis]
MRLEAHLQAHLRLAVLVGLHGTQADVARGAAQRVFEIDLDGGVVVFAARAEILLRGAAARLAAEQRREEIAELLVALAIARVVELEALVPAWRRLESAVGRHAGGQVVVGLPLLLVAQHVVGFVDVAHARFRVAFLADVRMVFARQLAIGAPDLVFGGVALHAENLVVVLELHIPAS